MNYVRYVIYVHAYHTHTLTHTHRMQSIRRSIRESFRRRRGTVSADDRKKIAESLNVEAGIKQSNPKGHRGRSSTEPASEMSPLHGRGAAAKGRPETAPAQVLIYTCIYILYYTYIHMWCTRTRCVVSELKGYYMIHVHTVHVSCACDCLVFS